jgi:hypothetical protein
VFTIAKWVWIIHEYLVNYPPHIQIVVGNFILSIPSPNTMDMCLDVGNGEGSAGLVAEEEEEVCGRRD